MPGVDVERMLEFFLPWADFELDDEAHRDGSESQFLVADEFLQARMDHEPPTFTIDEVLGG